MHTSFALILGWIIAHGYILMLLAMFVEGPIVTGAAAFASALGYFNIWIVVLLSILGDMIPDVFYYYLGYWGHNAILNKFAGFIRLSPDKKTKIEHLLKNHFIKTIITLKLTPLVSFPGFIIVGAHKLSIKKFIAACFFTTLPKTVLFVVLGYFFGKLFETNKYFKNIELLIFAAFIFIIIISVVYKKISAKIAKDIENI